MLNCLLFERGQPSRSRIIRETTKQNTLQRGKQPFVATTCSVDLMGVPRRCRVTVLLQKEKRIEIKRMIFYCQNYRFGQSNNVVRSNRPNCKTEAKLKSEQQARTTVKQGKSMQQGSLLLGKRRNTETERKHRVGECDTVRTVNN